MDIINNTSFYILGDGSNTLFVERTAPMIIKPDFKGITVTETEDSHIVTVGASENWHKLVCFCLEQGVNGLENLALIPGCVGAAPVQNIGAYGVEFADYCQQVEYFDFSQKKLITLSASECRFAYRDSIFKQALHNKGIITQVTLSFSKNWQPNLSYQGLDNLPNKSSATEIMHQVIKLRESKLPDPTKLPNAGSFFKNPVVNAQKFSALKSQYPLIPNYPQANGDVKLAAAWLIDEVGLKGITYKEVGVHRKQALVLVNYHDGTGQDIVSLAKYIQQQVKIRFDVEITPEVRMVTALGEKSFNELDDLTPINELNHD